MILAHEIGPFQNAYFGGFYVLEKPPALHWYYARAVASSLFSRYRHVSQYTWVDYSAADGRRVEVDSQYQVQYKGQRIRDLFLL